MYSYMDETSDDPGKGVFVVGGLLARGDPLFELERKWKKLRKRPDIDIAYFKAVECKNGRGEFAKFVAVPGKPSKAEHDKLDSINREFLSLIPKERYIFVQGVAVVQSEFYEVIQDKNARAILGHNPYRLAYDFAFIQCAWTMKQLEQEFKNDRENVAFGGWSREIVSFTCDEHEQYSQLADKAYRNLKDTNPNAAQYMGTFTSADDKAIEVLQAADAVAFEIRRVLGLALGSYSAVREQFRDLTKPAKVFLITLSNKELLQHIVANHLPGEPFKLDEIMERQLPPENIKFSFL
jgi:hypothetical protein